MSSLNGFGASKAAHLWPVALLRVYTGIFFAYHGFGKLAGGNFADGMEGFLNSRLEGTFAFFSPFIESVVLPNKAVFGFLVSWGELAIGAALIVGLATRWASIAGAVMLMSFWFAKGQGILDGQNHDIIWVVIFVVLATVHAGRIHGLDEKLADRFRFLR